MPTYSYRCADCAHAFDIHQAFTDDSLTVCPECGGTLRKVFGNIGVTFSGSGFYRTDSREGAKKPAAAESGSKSKDAAGAGASSGSGAATSTSGSGSSGASSSSGSSSSGSATGAAAS